MDYCRKDLLLKSKIQQVVCKIKDTYQAFLKLDRSG